ncbi:MAG: hypothetical protein M3Q44_03125 [bacterium]|nr:hypothetical protein [bacterium]
MENSNSLTSPTFLGPSKLFDRAWMIFEKKWKMALILALPIFGIMAAWLLIIGLFIGGIGITSAMSGRNTMALAGAGMVAVIVGIIAYVGFIGTMLWVQLAEIYLIINHEKEVTFKEAYGSTKKYIGSVLWIGILTGLFTAAGFVAFIIPGILIAVWFSLSQFVLVDQGVKGLNSLLTSREYVRGRWWAVFGRFAIFFLVFFIILILLGALQGVVEEGGYTLASVILSIVSFVVQLIFNFLTILYIYVIYENLKVLKGTNIPIASSTRKKFTILGFFGIVAFVLLLTIPLALIAANPAGWLTLGRDGTRLAQMAQTQAALSTYYKENNAYPKSLSTLEEKGLLDKVPVDPKTSTPFRYSLAADGKDYLLCTNLESPKGSDKRSEIKVDKEGYYCINSKAETQSDSMMQYAPGTEGAMLEGQDSSDSGLMMPPPGTRFMAPEDGGEYPSEATGSDLMRY